jgi:WhiB family redox-sensing transcriptional regulator
MSARDDGWLVVIMKRLTRLRRVPTGMLAEIVALNGACLEISADDDGPPRWLHEDGTDREVAALLCQGCPVQWECLELELRMFGEQTVGVWGALGEDDRRALVPHWRQSTARSAAPATAGQEQPSEPSGPNVGGGR